MDLDELGRLAHGFPRWRFTTDPSAPPDSAHQVAQLLSDTPLAPDCHDRYVDLPTGRLGTNELAWATLTRALLEEQTALDAALTIMGPTPQPGYQPQGQNARPPTLWVPGLDYPAVLTSLGPNDEQNTLVSGFYRMFCITAAFARQPDGQVKHDGRALCCAVPGRVVWYEQGGVQQTPGTAMQSVALQHFKVWMSILDDVWRKADMVPLLPALYEWERKHRYAAYNEATGWNEHAGDQSEETIRRALESGLGGRA